MIKFFIQHQMKKIFCKIRKMLRKNFSTGLTQRASLIQIKEEDW